MDMKQDLIQRNWVKSYLKGAIMKAQLILENGTIFNGRHLVILKKP
jgi:hypothetical protein